MFGVRLEQDEAHHGARIRQHQRVGIGRVHLALDFTGREFQRQVAAPVADKGPIVGDGCHFAGLLWRMMI
jgi:hypothetical protein